MSAQQWAMTLFDYKDEFQWIRALGWSDEELKRVPVHADASSGDDYINLANWGGTPLGVSEKAGGGTSANIKAIRNMYVYKSEAPKHLWDQLYAISDRGGPSAFEEDGKFGERGEATDFPPSH